MKKVITILGIAILVGMGITVFPQGGDCSTAVNVYFKPLPEVLLPGETYDVGGITTINRDGARQFYVAGIEYLSGGPAEGKLWPPKEWFGFEPKTFYSDPGQAQYTEVKLSIPLDAQGGDYFCLLGTFIGGPEGSHLGYQFPFTVAKTIPMKFFEIKEMAFSCKEKRGDVLNSLVGKFILGEGNNGIDFEKDKRILLIDGISVPEDKIRIIKIPGWLRKGEQYLLTIHKVENFSCPEPGKREVIFRVGDDLGKTNVELKSVGKGKALIMIHSNPNIEGWGFLERFLASLSRFWP
jgi:hypothetical protein